MTTVFAASIKQRFPGILRTENLPEDIVYKDENGQEVTKQLALATVDELSFARATINAAVMALVVELQAYTALENELRKLASPGSTSIASIVSGV